jgi:SNF2 family DNA or RNA helicase
LIPARAIKAYLNQPHDDHRWLKELNHKALDKRLAALDPPPRPWPGLGLHQKVALYLGIKYGAFAFWMDMGVGKTLATLEILQYWWDQHKLRRALIFVTSDKAFPTWLNQIKQYQINIPVVALDAGASEEKWRLLDDFGDGLVLLTYPGTIRMVGQKADGELAMPTELIERLAQRVDVLVMDESTKAANGGVEGGPPSLQFLLCEQIARRAQFRYALAGMPFGRDPKMLWAQHYLVDGGETLGRRPGLFMSAFYSKEKNDYTRATTFTFLKSKQPALSRMLQHRSITYAADECIDLPPVRSVIERVKLSAAARAYYQGVIDQIMDAKGDYRAMENAFLRMRQLSSGFLGLKNDETGDRVEIELDENPKLDRLLELSESLPEDRKAVVFYQYTHSGRRINEALSDMGMRPIWLWSGTKGTPQALSSFVHNPTVRMAVVNNQVGAYSLDELKVANYALFYESPVSPIDRAQAEKRLIRQGQPHRVFIYDLVVEDTVDERILEFHREGEDLFRVLLREPSAILRKIKTA